MNPHWNNSVVRIVTIRLELPVGLDRHAATNRLLWCKPDRPLLHKLTIRLPTFLGVIDGVGSCHSGPDWNK